MDTYIERSLPHTRYSHAYQRQSLTPPYTCLASPVFPSIQRSKAISNYFFRPGLRARIVRRRPRVFPLCPAPVPIANPPVPAPPKFNCGAPIPMPIGFCCCCPGCDPPNDIPPCDPNAAPPPKGVEACCCCGGAPKLPMPVPVFAGAAPNAPNPEDALLALALFPFFAAVEDPN